jgi:hypothetical protein
MTFFPTLFKLNLEPLLARSAVGRLAVEEVDVLALEGTLYGARRVEIWIEATILIICVMCVGGCVCVDCSDIEV